METGLRYRDNELSTADTAWLQMGMTCAQGWFDQDQPQEIEIRALVQKLLDRTEWDWMQSNSTGGNGISMGWHPERGFIERNWDGYVEGMAIYFLALGSQSHPAKDGAYDAWTEPYPKYWRGEGETATSLLVPTLGICGGRCSLTIALFMTPPCDRQGSTISRIAAAYLCPTRLRHCQPHGLGWLFERYMGHDRQ